MCRMSCVGCGEGESANARDNDDDVRGMCRMSFVKFVGGWFVWVRATLMTTDLWNV